jgi:hypothetical protein
MSHYVTDDFDIMPMPEHNIENYILTEEEEREILEKNDDPQANIRLKKPMPEYTNLNIKFLGKKDDQPKKFCIKIKDPSKMTIRELKSYL